MLEPRLTRKKSVRECTCKTTELREEGEELTMLEPEKVSEQNNGTTELSLPSVESNGTDYGGMGRWDDGSIGRGECDAKTQSWTDPGTCLDKCSKKKKCGTLFNIEFTCQKVCLFEKGSKYLKYQTAQECKDSNKVRIGGKCTSKCNKNSECQDLTKQFKNFKSVRCQSVCVEK